MIRDQNDPRSKCRRTKGQNRFLKLNLKTSIFSLALSIKCGSFNNVQKYYKAILCILYNYPARTAHAKREFSMISNRTFLENYLGNC